MEKQNLVAVYQGGAVISDYINNLLNSRPEHLGSMSTRLQQAYDELAEKITSLEQELVELTAIPLKIRSMQYTRIAILRKKHL